MTENVDLFPSLSSLLREALGDLLSPDATSFLDMCADTIVFEFPYAPQGFTESLVGKAALEEYLPTVGDLLTIESMSLGRVLISSNSDAATVEFSCKGYSDETGTRYDQDYVSVIDLKDGLITRYRDYWNPITLLNATSSASSSSTEEAR
ncbi:ketosteroid isomerase [Rhizobium sp. Leaf311]|nr:ketosteroid isomerase [Rhizobium sp. Leaf311]